MGQVELGLRSSNLHMAVKIHTRGGSGKPSLEHFTHIENPMRAAMSQKRIDSASPIAQWVQASGCRAMVKSERLHTAFQEKSQIAKSWVSYTVPENHEEEGLVNYLSTLHIENPKRVTINQNQFNGT